MDKEFEIRFNDLTERLKRIENNIEFSRIMSDVVFKLKKTIIHASSENIFIQKQFTML